MIQRPLSAREHAARLAARQAPVARGEQEAGAKSALGLRRRGRSAQSRGRCEDAPCCGHVECDSQGGDR